MAITAQCLSRTLLSIVCIGSVLLGVDSLPAQVLPVDGKPYVYQDVEGKELKAYVFFPKENRQSRPAILLFHGGAWQLGDASWMFDRARDFASHGMVAIAVEYRLSLNGQSPVDGVKDACTAFVWTRQHSTEFQIDPKKVAGYGVSAGGHLIASVGTLPAIDSVPIPKEGRPDAMLLYSPALNVGADPYFLRLMKDHGDSHQYSPSEFISHKLPPTLIIQGEKDSIVFAKDAQAFCTKAKQFNARCELHIYPDVGHLLTRNLKVQYKDFDSDPEDAADAHEREDSFLRMLRYIQK